jgi:predicted transcriptional regulator
MKGRRTPELTDGQKRKIRKTIRTWLRLSDIDQKSLADNMDLTPAAVNRWVTYNEKHFTVMNITTAKVLEKISKGKVPLSVTRPDQIPRICTIVNK